MDLVVDFLLLSASAAACLFCFVLNRRLRGLTSAKGGLGAGVAALSKSAEEMKAAIASSKHSADDAAARLETLIAQADKKAEHLQGVSDQLAEMSASVVAHAEGAAEKYIETVTPFLEDANETANRLFVAIERAPAPRRDATSLSQAFARRDADDNEESEERAVEIDEGAPRLKTRSKRARPGVAA